MSSDPLLWELSGRTRNEWNEIYHCYESCCHRAHSIKTGGKVKCGEHCDDWPDYDSWPNR